MEKDTQIHVKKELLDPNFAPKPYTAPGTARPVAFIDLSSSDSDSDDDDNARKKRRMAESAVLPVGFLDPLPQPSSEQLPLVLPSTAAPAHTVAAAPIAKQFWKAGDYEDAPSGDWGYSNGGMDHVRVHPRFLHSNATSHKWALGAFAELMDNSLDEVCNGATYVNMDMVKSKKDGGKMLLIEDNGGGMDPEKMRHCVSLGYSAKSKMADTIGQYGNGFKTSTMRLGADVIVFSRCRGKNGLRSTQSIGLLSYTFLRSTGKEDIVVPMLDYERSGQDWIKIIRSSVYDWDRNVETILQWSPFSSEDELLRQFNQIQDQGTRIIIYNIWEDDEGLLELDFDTDPHDIQIRGVNRDEKNIDMAKNYPNSKHFLTYRHSLKSYAAILYLRIPPGFRIILRGKDVEHHNIVNDMMMSQEITYRPQPANTEEIPKNLNMVATVTVGFVKDAKAHIDVQGFNVYHKNRLIKPFWRVWHPPGSDGRGVIGVLEADFVEPAHDKQGFERTTVLSKLEARLIHMQKTYWTTNCHKIGYAPRVNKKVNQREISPDSFPRGSRSKTRNFTLSDKTPTKFGDKGSNSGRLNGKGDVKRNTKQPNRTEQSLSSDEYLSDDDRQNTSRKHNNGSSSKDVFSKDGSHRLSGLRSRKGEEDYPPEMPSRTTRNSKPQENGLNDAGNSPSNSSSSLLDRLKLENLRLKERLKRKEEEVLGDLLNDLNKEKERSQSLEAQLLEAGQKHEELTKEQESLIDIFSEERQRRDIEEENLRRSMKEASNTIKELLAKMRVLERSCNTK